VISSVVVIGAGHRADGAPLGLIINSGKRFGFHEVGHGAVQSCADLVQGVQSHRDRFGGPQGRDLAQRRREPDLFTRDQQLTGPPDIALCGDPA
jgi:hypothetical protein